MTETLRTDLNEAKGHAKEAALATLRAMRGALDLAIEKLGADDQAEESATPPAPEGSASPPDDGLSGDHD